MKPRVINWGIIGAGSIAEKFATDLQSVSNCKLYAIASRNLDKADDFKKNHYTTLAYGSYLDLVLDKNVDAVYIATPHTFHKTHTLLCLNAFKPVLCEKPFAMNAKDVESIIRCSKRNNTLVMEALWTAFLPHFQFVENLIKQKHFGEVLKLEANFGFYREYDHTIRLFDKSVGGGSLLDIGIYPVFAALSTLGRPKQINAKASFFENGADSSCDIEFNYPSAKAILKSSLIEETPTTALFYCEQGSIKINTRFHEPSSLLLTDVNGNSELIEFDCLTNGYNYEIEHFNQLIRSDKIESDIMTFKRSLELISALDHIRSLIGLNYS